MFRVVGATRRSRSAGSSAPAGSGSRVRTDGHPAMSGIKVSPVHGHHCICGRCSMLSRRQG